MLTLGVDPGLHGALAFYRPKENSLTIVDMPTLTLPRGGKMKGEVDITALANLIDRPEREAINNAAVEQVGSMPNQGVSSVFSFGKSYGVVLGVLGAHFIPVQLVPPRRWKTALRVPASKDGARARASAIWPQHAHMWSRVKDDGRAEAALIAYWEYLRLTGASVEKVISEDIFA